MDEQAKLPQEGASLLVELDQLRASNKALRNELDEALRQVSSLRQYKQATDSLVIRHAQLSERAFELEAGLDAKFVKVQAERDFYKEQLKSIRALIKLP
jgi:hypothetical protein